LDPIKIDIYVEWSKFYSLNEGEIKKIVPTEPGIYVLWVKLVSNKWKIFYGASAENLQQQILSHLLSGETNDCIKKKVQNSICAFHFASVPKKVEREGINKYFFSVLPTECKQADPGKKPMSVNLPG